MGAPSNLDHVSMSQYIQDTALHMIPASAMEDLEQPITPSDFLGVIKHLENAKSSGPDLYTKPLPPCWP